MKTGLILEGGGMRGVFTAGVLDAFIENKITFDNCIGVSAGAGHACSYLSNQFRRAFDVNVDYLKDKRHSGIRSLIKTGDFFGADFIYNEIPNKLNIYDNKTFMKNKTKFEVVVTNLETGEPEYKEIKDLSKDINYVRASSSLPLLSRIVELDNKKYLDGGISDSVPLKHFLNKGIKKNVIVLTREKEYRKKQSKNKLISKVYKNYPLLIKQLEERASNYNDTINLINKLEDEGKVFVIRPPKSLNLGRIEKNYKKLKDAYEIGYEEGKKAIKDLKKFLK